jgi:serine/threonine protein kinase
VSTESKFSTLEGPERLIGSRVLEFELTGVLGAGGMSVVYRAKHRVTHQEVAIKILPPELATHEELKARFVEEARVLALLDHPNVVSLNNFCEAGGRLCLIMQFVDGTTFEHMIIQKGQLPASEVARVGIEVLKALEYAHKSSVIHRDIKPSNVLVRTDGTVKVTDFGIAKIVGATRLTSTGQTMGTVRYMSPEQVRGKQVDLRSDIYSLGVTLYEGLSGRTPFEGENQFEIMQQHLNRKPPPLEEMGVEVPPAFEKLLMRAMEKNPADRFEDAASFRSSVEALLPALGATVSASKLRPRRSKGSPLRHLALGLGASVAIAGVGAGLFLALRPTPPKPPAAAATPGKPKRPGFLPPHTLPGKPTGLDETFEQDGLRVQTLQGDEKRDVKALRDRYVDLTRVMREFMAASDEPSVKTAATGTLAPLTLVVVSSKVLEEKDLWPGYDIKPGTGYLSRYVPLKRTLFIADDPGFEKKELPYAMALHVLAPVPGLPNDKVYSLAEKFEAYYNSRGPK